MIYLVIILDSVRTMLLVIMWVMVSLSLGLGIAGLVVYLKENIEDKPLDDRHKPLFSYLKKSIIGVIIPIILLGFTPTTKQAAVIYVTPKIVKAVSENKEMMELPTNITKLANDWIKELSPEKNEKEGK